MHDRGAMKWTSLMLPEQIEGLKRIGEEQNHKEKPILDEQQIYENDFRLRAANQYKAEVRITYFYDHDFHVAEGLVERIKNNFIHLDVIGIDFDDIVEVEFVYPIE